MDFGGITALVGGNNSGKTSIIKGALLMHDFIQTKIGKDGICAPEFKFNSEHVNTGNFESSFCNDGDGNTMTFEYGLEDFVIKVAVQRVEEVNKDSEVSSIEINDTVNNVKFNIDFDDKCHVFVLFGLSEEEKAIKEKIEEGINASRMRGYNAYKKHNNIGNESKDIADFTKNNVSPEDHVKSKFFNVTLDENAAFHSGEYLLVELISAIANKSKIEEKTPLLMRIADRLDQAIDKDVVDYICTPSLSLSRNEDNDTTNVILDFYEAHISENDEEFLFLQKWLEEFEIGTSIKVCPNLLNNNDVIVYEGTSDHGVDLADMGKGSMRMAILLMRLATLIHDHKGDNVCVIIEYPEMYLYPALQSKLADILFDLYKQFGFHSIVETHSEYLIRESQVIVANANKYLRGYESPFMVYYLPDNGELPYLMNYRSDGLFSNEFGEGFYNASIKLLYKIL